MAVYELAPLFEPQIVAQSAAAALTFAPVGGAVVPANVRYQINVLRVVNINSAPVTLKIWRVPSGSTAIDVNVVVPVTVTVPVATNTFPHFDVTSLWGAVLRPGDSIWALAGTANMLNISGDGTVIS